MAGRTCQRQAQIALASPCAAFQLSRAHETGFSNVGQTFGPRGLANASRSSRTMTASRCSLSVLPQDYCRLAASHSFGCRSSHLVNQSQHFPSTRPAEPFSRATSPAELLTAFQGSSGPDLPASRFDVSSHFFLLLTGLYS